MIQYQLIIKYRKVYTMLELRNLKNNNQEYFKLIIIVDLKKNIVVVNLKTLTFRDILKVIKKFL
jgi:hypothetical protein